MANQEHVDILKEGVEVWNRWREENFDIIPNLEGAKLWEDLRPKAGLEGILFYIADLQEINLYQTNLQGAYLQRAILKKADLHRANLQNITMWEANLQEANLQDASLQNANLRGTNLQKTKLRHANFQGADLRDANLLKSDLLKVNLQGANLQEANLQGANLQEANLQDVNLQEANLQGANLYKANLGGANLARVRLQEAEIGHSNLEATNLRHANLKGANLRYANLHAARLYFASCSNTKLFRANLKETNLFGANLSDADLEGAKLHGANFQAANLVGVNFEEAIFSGTGLSNVGLEQVRGLNNCFHQGRSDISSQTLVKSKGKIPIKFLQGCGLADWEIESAKLYKPDLSNQEITDINYKIIEIRLSQAIQINQLFISCSHLDVDFINKIGEKLTDEGIRYWRGSQHATAGKLEKQIDRAMRLNDTVLLVLSKNSVNSDWVEHEATSARELEQELGKDVLCPIAVDDSWKSCDWPKKLRRQIEKYNILDFSDWQNPDSFHRMFAKLLNGLDLFY